METPYLIDEAFIAASSRFFERCQLRTMSGNAKVIPVTRLGDEKWFHRTGRVAMSIGKDTFHRELIDLFGSAI